MREELRVGRFWVKVEKVPRKLPDGGAQEALLPRSWWEGLPVRLPGQQLRCAGSRLVHGPAAQAATPCRNQHALDGHQACCGKGGFLLQVPWKHLWLLERSQVNFTLNPDPKSHDWISKLFYRHLILVMIITPGLKRRQWNQDSGNPPHVMWELGEETGERRSRHWGASRKKWSLYSHYRKWLI